MKKFTVPVLVFFVLFVFVAILITSGSGPDSPAPDAPEKPKFKVAWSIYAGWMPWPYADQSGTLQKWADAHGVEVELVQMDYIASVEAYVTQQVDAVVITNMETLDMPAASGVDSTVVIVGDYSNGNDAILAAGIDSVAGLHGQKISLVELSVSHYLLARALEKNGLSERDVTLLNTSDSDIATAFLTNSSNRKAVVTWNPMVMTIAQADGVNNVFSSAETPGEILDLMVVRTDALKIKDGALGKVLAGCWYEVLSVMSGNNAAADAALAEMAKLSQCTLPEYRAQLTTTAMFWQPRDAFNYMTRKEMQANMDYVRQFCFSHGLLGANAPSADVVGISYPDGTVQGDPNNVRMRFDATYTQLAMQGKLKR